MIKYILKYFLFFFFCAISTSVFSDQGIDTYNELKSNNEFIMLSSFLEEKGFVIPLKKLTKTAKVNELNTENFIGTYADISVSVVPFVSREGSSARIAHWSGMWQGNYHTGAIAVVNEADIYIYTNDTVVSVKAEELTEYMTIPLYTIEGEAPFGLDQIEAFEHPVQASSEIKALLSMQSGCKSVDVSRNGYTILGFLAWKFHHTKRFCYDGNQVSNVILGEYVSDMDALHYYRGVTSSSDFFYARNSGHESMKQGHIENCIIKYGCIFSNYPAVKIIAYANGSWTHSTWQ